MTSDSEPESVSRLLTVTISMFPVAVRHDRHDEVIEKVGVVLTSMRIDPSLIAVLQRHLERLSEEEFVARRVEVFMDLTGRVGARVPRDEIIVAVGKSHIHIEAPGCIR